MFARSPFPLLFPPASLKLTQMLWIVLGLLQDLGNSNYCIMQPRAQFTRRANAELVARALNRRQVPASVNERHDIVVEGFKMSPPNGRTRPMACFPELTVVVWHISGSAFKLVNKRAYHHGTMLLNARLQDLKGVLNNEKVFPFLLFFATVPNWWYPKNLGRKA
jgi:lipoate-protein ligase A